METISFKEVTLNDLDVLVPVAQKAYLQAYTNVWQNNNGSYYVERSFTKKAFTADLEDLNTDYQLIYFNDTPVGFYKLELDSPVTNYNKKEAIQLEKIYILYEFSGKGIGKAAFENIIMLARSRKKIIFWVDVMDTSLAKKFYQKMGFETVSYYDLTYPGLKPDQLKMHRMVLKLIEGKS